MYQILFIPIKVKILESWVVPAGFYCFWWYSIGRFLLLFFLSWILNQIKLPVHYGNRVFPGSFKYKKKKNQNKTNVFWSGASGVFTRAQRRAVFSVNCTAKFFLGLPSQRAQEGGKMRITPIQNITDSSVLLLYRLDRWCSVFFVCLFVFFFLWIWSFSRVLKWYLVAFPTFSLVLKLTIHSPKSSVA